MQYWWVNHRQSWREEIAGKFLWSPIREARDRRSQFYDNMRAATRGDAVLSYAEGFSYYGVVTDDAIGAPKPDFGSVGAYWSDEGWRLPVAWIPMPRPVPLNAVIADLRPLLPEKYSPLERERDRGAQKAYLTNIGKAAFEVVQRFAGFELPPLAGMPLTYDLLEAELDEQAQRAILDDPALSSTEKQQLVNARLGQGLFRQRLSEVEIGCRVTGITNPALLIAGHIKPWRACSSAAERLSGHNGLLLTPSIDRLFDRGFITFDDEGDVVFSPRLSRDDIDRIGFPAREARRPLSPEQRHFLEHHREITFLK